MALQRLHRFLRLPARQGTKPITCDSGLAQAGAAQQRQAPHHWLVPQGVREGTRPGLLADHQGQTDAQSWAPIAPKVVAAAAVSTSRVEDAAVLLDGHCFQWEGRQAKLLVHSTHVAPLSEVTPVRTVAGPEPAMRQAGSVTAAACDTGSSQMPDPSGSDIVSGETGLRDLRLRVERDEICAVVGGVASGKSSLLLALLGEMPTAPLHRTSTSQPSDSLRSLASESLDPSPMLPPALVRPAGMMAYAPQVGWVLNATLRDNILMGRAADEETLRRVVWASCLDDDVAAMPAGLGTEVGERGGTLSVRR